MDPNDKTSDSFASQPLPGPKTMHVCKVGRCVIVSAGGTVTPESKKRIERFFEEHPPKE